MTARNTYVWERLKAVRSLWGITQPEMASRMGVSLRAYQNYETNEREPKVGDVAGLVTEGVDLNWLLTGDGQMRRDALPVAAPPIDYELLSQVIEGVELLLTKLRKTLAPDKKAKVITMLYRSFSADHRVNIDVIREMIELAA